MNRTTPVFSFLVMAVLGFALACAKPPTIEITDAENALNAAEQAGALEYATADYEAAKDALTDAKAKVESKDYKAALASALDAKSKAESAVASVEAGKTAAKASAESGIAAVDGELKTLGDSAKKLKGAVAAEIKSTLDSVESDWTKVKEDFLNANYNRVNSSVKAVQARLEEIKTKVADAAKASASGKKKK